jgi:negative regulator of genetic competence, sporulation and motility
MIKKQGTDMIATKGKVEPKIETSDPREGDKQPHRDTLRRNTPAEQSKRKQDEHDPAAYKSDDPASRTQTKDTKAQAHTENCPQQIGKDRPHRDRMNEEKPCSA